MLQEDFDGEEWLNIQREFVLLEGGREEGIRSKGRVGGGDEGEEGGREGGGDEGEEGTSQKNEQREKEKKKECTARESNPGRKNGNLA